MCVTYGRRILRVTRSLMMVCSLINVRFRLFVAMTARTVIIMMLLCAYSCGVCAVVKPTTMLIMIQLMDCSCIMSAPPAPSASVAASHADFSRLAPASVGTASHGEALTVAQHCRCDMVLQPSLFCDSFSAQHAYYDRPSSILRMVVRSRTRWRLF